MCCCKPNKGFTPVVDLLGPTEKIEAKGFYNISVENKGEEDVTIMGSATLSTGDCKPFGIVGYPCAVDLTVAFAKGTGTKQILVTKYRLDPYKDPDDCPPVDLDKASTTSVG